MFEITKASPPASSLSGTWPASGRKTPVVFDGQEQISTLL